MFSVATKIQQWVPFALLSRNKIFRTAVINIKVLKSLCKAPDVFVRFLPKFGVYGQISVKVFNIKFHPPQKNRPVGAAMIRADRQTDRPDATNRRYSRLMLTLLKANVSIAFTQLYPLLSGLKFSQ